MTVLDILLIAVIADFIAAAVLGGWLAWEKR